MAAYPPDSRGKRRLAPRGKRLDAAPYSVKAVQVANGCSYNNGLNTATKVRKELLFTNTTGYIYVWFSSAYNQCAVRV